MTSDDVKSAYPARFYARYDTKAPQPTSVTGWYDTWGLSTVAAIPSADEMIPLTQEQWEDQEHFRLPAGRGVLKGAIVDYTPPPVMVPLSKQAVQAITNAAPIAAIMWAANDTIDPALRDYIKKLAAIINGTDTISTSLPSIPDLPKEYAPWLG